MEVCVGNLTTSLIVFKKSGNNNHHILECKKNDIHKIDRKIKRLLITVRGESQVIRHILNTTCKLWSTSSF